MAPRDIHERQDFLDPEERCSCDDEEEQQANKDDRGWKKRLVVRLRRLLVGTEQGSDDSSFYKKKNKLAATAVLAIAAVALYRARRRRSNNDDAWKRRLLPLLLAALQRPEYHKAVDVSLSILRSAAIEGLVSKALVGAGEILFQDAASGRWKRSKLPPNSPSVQSDLLDLLSRGGCLDVAALPESVWSRLGTPVLAALPFIYLAFMYKMFKNMNGNGDMNSKLLDHSKQPTRFSDVAGLDSIMAEVQEIVTFLKNPSIYHAVGAQPPRGILLHGPPGSGKTLLAQAVAGEANCDAFLACSGSDFCEMYVGRGASRVRSLFDNARCTAKNRRHGLSSCWWPSWQSKTTMASTTVGGRPATAIIFIDELDALAKSRSYGAGLHSNDERDQTLNQLLTEMEGFPSQDKEVTIIIIAATNRADVLDPAILRRFDRQIHVPYPSQQGRSEILKIHARRTHCNIDQIDWEHLASMTNDASGSDLRNLVNDAALLAVRDRSPTVEQSHLEHAARRTRAMKTSADLGATTSTSHPFVWYPANK